MLKQRWLIIVFGIVMQYVHGVFTQLAHRMHQPQEEPLHDLGFDMTPVRPRQLDWCMMEQLSQAAHCAMPAGAGS